MCLPGCCFRRLISVARSPLKTGVAAQLAALAGGADDAADPAALLASVASRKAVVVPRAPTRPLREKTILGISFIGGAKGSVEVGHQATMS